jgi:hypothetical protein
MICFYDGSLHQPFIFTGLGAFWFWKKRQSHKRHSTVPSWRFEENVSRDIQHTNCRPNTSKKKNEWNVLAHDRVFGIGVPIQKRFVESTYRLAARLFEVRARSGCIVLLI